MKSVAASLCLSVAVSGFVGLVSPLPARAQEMPRDQQEQVAPQPAPRPRARVVPVAPTPAMEAVFWHACKAVKCIAMTLVTIHILLAVWVFLDIRKRGEGHGIFVALALLGGLPATILYALVRLGDLKKT